jgi:adenosylcobinamide kinase / adenosylcobinamide-phosphate guanylyltransferase
LSVESATLTFVIGGARSGKSRFAEQLVEESGLTPVYIATGQGMDEEMVERIALHRRRRGNRWLTVEAPIDLPAAVRNEAKPGNMLLVDTVTMWIANLMAAGRNIAGDVDSLLAAVAARKAPIVVVSDETGLGIVPDNAIARLFRDHAGTANQAVARLADRVFLVAAGIPVCIKPNSESCQ